MSDTPRTDKCGAACLPQPSMAVCARAFERELAALNARIQAIADEAFGPLPQQSIDDNLTTIERGIAKLMSENEDWRAQLERIAQIIKQHWDSPISIEEHRKVRDALEVANNLIQKHHDCSKQVRLGEMCPHCCDKEGKSPELDQIWDALTRKNSRVSGANGGPAE